MSTLAVKASRTGSEDNGLNWLVFELLWRDFFRCTFYAFRSLALFASFSPTSIVTKVFMYFGIGLLVCLLNAFAIVPSTESMHNCGFQRLVFQCSSWTHSYVQALCGSQVYHKEIWHWKEVVRGYSS